MESLRGRGLVRLVGITTNCRMEKLHSMNRNPLKRGLVLEPQLYLWRAGPVMVNEPQKAELRVRKIS